MNDDPRDKAVEDAYRDVPKEAPPPELDARILAAARRAVNAGPQDAARKPSWLSRYRVPLSVAATAVIAVSVSLLVDDESRRGAEFDAPAKAQRADPAWGSRSSPAGMPVEQRIPSDRDAAEQSRARRNVPDAPRAAEAPAAPAAAIVQQPAATASDVERAASETKAMARRAESSTANAAPATAREATPDSASGPAAAAQAPAPSSAAAGATAAPPPPAAAAPLAAPPAAPRSAAQVPGVESRERADSERPSRLTRDEAASGARRMAKEETARTPEAWLEDIRRLRTEGRLTDADAALAAFQRAYPDYALPADLRPLSR